MGYYSKGNKLETKLTTYVPLFGGNLIIFGNINFLKIQDNHKMKKKKKKRVKISNLLGGVIL
jgi:hypothetical protein